MWVWRVEWQPEYCLKLGQECVVCAHHSHKSLGLPTTGSMVEVGTGCICIPGNQQVQEGGHWGLGRYHSRHWKLIYRQIGAYWQKACTLERMSYMRSSLETQSIIHFRDVFANLRMGTRARQHSEQMNYWIKATSMPLPETVLGKADPIVIIRQLLFRKKWENITSFCIYSFL